MSDAFDDAVLEALEARLKGGHRERIALTEGRLLWLYWEIVAIPKPKTSPLYASDTSQHSFEPRFVVEITAPGNHDYRKAHFKRLDQALAHFNVMLEQHAVAIALAALGIKS